MSAPASPLRTAADLASRERRVKDMLERIEATVAELRHRHTAGTFQAVARKAPTAAPSMKSRRKPRR